LLWKQEPSIYIDRIFLIDYSREITLICLQSKIFLFEIWFIEVRLYGFIEHTWFVIEPLCNACLWLCEYRSQTQNTVYEIISDMSSRQDAIEERLTNLEDKMQSIQVWQTIGAGLFQLWFTKNPFPLRKYFIAGAHGKPSRPIVSMSDPAPGADRAAAELFTSWHSCSCPHSSANAPIDVQCSAHAVSPF